MLEQLGKLMGRLLPNRKAGHDTPPHSSRHCPPHGSTDAFDRFLHEIQEHNENEEEAYKETCRKRHA